MSFATQMTKTAERLLAKFGDSVELVDRTNCVYDPVTGEDTCVEEIFGTVGAITNYTLAETTQTDVLLDDLNLLVSVPLTITKNYQVIYDGKRWQVLSVTRTRTQNSTIVQSLQIRALG